MLIEHIISLLPTFGCAFWTILIIIDMMQYGDRGVHRKLLWWILTTTILYACHAVYFVHGMQLMVVADTVYTYCNLAAYPLYARYLLHLTRGGTSRRMDALLLMPPLIMAGAVALLYLLMGAEGRQEFVQTYLYGSSLSGLQGLAMTQAVVHIVCKPMFVVGIVFTLVTGIRHVREYNDMVDSVFADNEDKHLWGLSKMLWCVGVVSIMSLLSISIGKSSFTHSYLLLSIPSVLFTIILYALAYIGYRNTFSFRELRQMVHDDGAAFTISSISTAEATQPYRDDCPAEDNTQFVGVEVANPQLVTPPPYFSKAEPVTISPATEENTEPLADRLKRIIINEELYLHTNLKVDDLSAMLSTNVRYIQRAFNEEIGMSFAEYINRQRIAHAEELLRKHPDMKVFDVSIRSGFGSVSAYYRNLKRYGRK